MEWDQMTDAEIDKAFDAAFAHVQPVKTIDARPPGFFRRYVDNWRNAPLHVAMIAIVIAGFVLPWTILIGGIVCLAVWDSVVG